ncbi:hypothetical protein NC651_006124 [Populus alba x Populus x berolinensis]|nr:hypothetical protein NC651_006124 [Populus alba x Populus x berolinensis]
MLYVLGLKDRLKNQKITSCATCFPVTLSWRGLRIIGLHMHLVKHEIIRTSMRLGL